MRRLSLIIVGLVVLGCWQAPAREDASNADASNADAKEPIPVEHVIRVQLEEVDGNCACTHPVKDVDDDYKVHVWEGDLVKWTFKNDCAEEMMVGIDNFGIPDRYKEEDEKTRLEGDRYPLEAGCKLELKVAGGGSEGMFECLIKNGIVQDKITWKYDIVQHRDGEKFVLLDPELEIPGRLN